MLQDPVLFVPCQFFGFFTSFVSWTRIFRYHNVSWFSRLVMNCLCLPYPFRSSVVCPLSSNKVLWLFQLLWSIGSTFSSSRTDLLSFVPSCWSFDTPRAFHFNCPCFVFVVISFFMIALFGEWYGFVSVSTQLFVFVSFFPTSLYVHS